MEVGIGHHGEPGLEVVPLETAADEMARRMTDIILPDLPFPRRGRGDGAVSRASAPRR